MHLQCMTAHWDTMQAWNERNSHEVLDPHSFVHEQYSMKKYKLDYGHSVKPIPDQEKWPFIEHPTLLPYVIKRGDGRLCRKTKISEDKEKKGKKSKIVKYGEFGHKKATCMGGATKNQQKATLKGKGNKASTSKSKGKETSKELKVKTVRKGMATKKGKGKVR